MGRLFKPVLFSVLLLPALAYLLIIVRIAMGEHDLLGPDPAQSLVLTSGEWAIRMLLLALAVTPLRILLGLPRLMRVRRLIGLFALFYALLHFLCFYLFILEGEPAAFARELADRPYIMAGMLALAILVLLGLTSFAAAQRRLGRLWKKLHRAVYLAGVAAVVHLLWLTRSDYGQVLVYGSLLVMLLGHRVLLWMLPAARNYSLSLQSNFGRGK